MKILRWLLASFSLYSRIPVPGFKGSEDDYAHSLIFFPLVGAVIGVVIYGINSSAGAGVIPVTARIFLTILCPILVTGGFHLDGFMDTEDALNSYGSARKKLEILKDPHIGAFAVISLVKWGLLYGAAVSAILVSEEAGAAMPQLCISFVISRCLSGLTSICFEKAKKGGMLYEETRSHTKLMILFLAAELVAAALFSVCLDPFSGIMGGLFFALFTFWYRRKMNSEFGGVTGDTAGFFVTVSEILEAVLLAVCVLIRGVLL